MGSRQYFRMQVFFAGTLTLCVLVTPKCEPWQTLKTQMKWSIMWHLSGTTLFYYDKMIFRERNAILFGNDNM